MIRLPDYNERIALLLKNHEPPLFRRDRTPLFIIYTGMCGFQQNRVLNATGCNGCTDEFSVRLLPSASVQSFRVWRILQAIQDYIQFYRP